MENISPHCSYWEGIRSQTAINYNISNVPSEQVLKAMCLTAEKVFEPLRTLVGGPVHISSFYRSIRINKLIGGSATSQHCKGQAMDIEGIHCSNKELFHLIYNNLLFDQLIWEFGDENNPNWVHVSYSANKNRKEALRSVHLNGRTFYQRFNPES